MSILLRKEFPHAPPVSGNREALTPRHQYLNEVAAWSGEPAPFPQFEPCSHCGATTPEEVSYRCTSFDRACFEPGQPCHGEAP